MLIIALFIIMIFVFFYSISNTIFDISLEKNSLAGIFFIKDLFFFVVIGVFLFEFYGIDKFYTFYMTQESMEETSIIIFYSIIFLFIFIKFFSKYFFKKYLIINNLNSDDKYIFYRSLITTLIILLISLVFIFTYFGLKHSFIYSLMGYGGLIDIRLNNRYSGIPTVLISYFNFLSIFLSCVVGAYLTKYSKISAIFLIIIVMIFSSYFGGKAPVINSILLLFFSYLASNSGLKLNFNLIIKLCIFLIILTLSLLAVIKLQFPDLNGSEVFDFIVNRIGVAQIHGAYEQFSLKLNSPKYILHTIPFANLFYDYIPYNKDLMMHTWGYYGDNNDTGVMNSLFIGEALAIGGYWLVFFSPLIVALNFCFVAAFLVYILKSKFYLPLREAQKIAALITVSYISFTADITGLLFFKSFFMILFFCLSILFTFICIKKVKLRL